MSQGASIMENGKDRTIDVTLNINQDGIELQPSGKKSYLKSIQARVV